MSSRAAREEMIRLDVDEDEEYRIVVGRGLHVERRTYQWLSDEGLLPPAVTRTLLHEVDDEIDDLSLHGSGHELGSTRRQRSATLERLTRRLLSGLPEPAGSDPEELAYAEATARRLAARRTADAFDVFDDLSAIRPETVERARSTVRGWEQEAIDELDELDTSSRRDANALHAQQIATLTRAASHRELKQLVDSGLLPDQALTLQDL
jgi:CPA1 family monovalent cation:H+ antiporter